MLRGTSSVTRADRQPFIWFGIFVHSAISVIQQDQKKSVKQNGRFVPTKVFHVRPEGPPEPENYITLS